MKRVLACAIVGVLCAFTGSATASTFFQPGAPGIGDPYFPLDGNGGYDVGHYSLDLTYDPATAHLDGVATIEATATREPLELQSRPDRPQRRSRSPSTAERDVDAATATS